MATTVFKGYEAQATSSNPGSWGTVLNEDMIEIVDRNLGGMLSVALSASNVVLTTEESQYAILSLSGTLLANVQITTSCLGFFFVANGTTGAFTVTITNGSGSAVVPQGARTLFMSTSGGVKQVGEGFASGTSLLFCQTTVPTGWTKVNTNDNSLLRVVTGAPGTGGTNDFTTVNSGLMLARANLPNDTVTTTTDGAHNHTFKYERRNVSSGSSGGMRVETLATSSGDTTLTVTTNGDHTHTIALNGGVSQTAVDLNIKYVDAYRATKDA